MDLYHSFAEILDYPTPSLSQKVVACRSRLTSVDSDAVRLFADFQAFVQTTPVEKMEEIYTRTFELHAICHPYVGHYLFGDGSRRGLFMSGLKERYKMCGFSAGNELPDHLGIMLRFASSCTLSDREELAKECMIPAVERMISAFEDDTNPYKTALEVLLLFLQKEGTDQTAPKIEPEGFYNGR